MTVPTSTCKHLTTLTFLLVLSRLGPKAARVCALLFAPALLPFLSSMMNAALVLDWDWSVVNENTDTFVPGQLDPTLLRYIHERSSSGVQWTALMADVARKLHSKGFVQADIDRALCAIPVFKEILQAIQLAYEHGLDVHVVSDANQVYIDTIARHLGIDRCITSVVTNKAAFNAAGLLVIGPHQPSASPHGCPRCPVNLCKGLALDRLGLSYEDSGGAALRDEHRGRTRGSEMTVERMARPRSSSRGRRRSSAAGGALRLEGGSGTSSGGATGSVVAPARGSGALLLKKRVLYLGDGRGDLCACLRLGP
jgi:2,3-diketo-5-methylthio-1-phosphopentane phosphatase